MEGNQVTIDDLVEILRGNKGARDVIINSLVFLNLVSANSELVLPPAHYSTDVVAQIHEECKFIRSRWKKDLAPNLLIKDGNLQLFSTRIVKFLSTYNEYTLKDVDNAVYSYLMDCNNKGRLAKSPEFFVLNQHSKDFKEGDLYEWICREPDVDFTIYV